MTDIVLHNKGSRTIILGEVSFKPKQTKAFNKKDSDLLLKLYGDEIENLESVTAQFKAEEKVEDARFKTKKDVIEFLTEQGIEFNSADKKEVLIEIAENLEASKEQ